jgi:serine/threonine protein kinase
MVKSFTKQILNALVCIHENFIIHGDLKAANILFNGYEIKISDFGESMRDANLENVTMSGSRIMSNEINGSMLWMAPELFLEKGRGRRSDIWSLGCTLIELLTANNPWPEVKEVS